MSPTTPDLPIPSTHTHSVGPHPLSADQLLRSQETTLARLVATGTIADSRGGLVISSNLAMLGALVATLSGAHLPKVGPLLWTMVAIASVACVASIAMAALAAFPRPGTRPGSLVFFGSIAAMNREMYFDKLRNVAQEDFARDLADQCHRVATLAALKFRWVRRAMAMMIVAAVPWLAGLALARNLYFA